MKFSRKNLWPFPLKKVDDGDEEEEGGNGNEEDVDDDGSGE